jgi:hypothetical protein
LHIQERLGRRRERTNRPVRRSLKKLDRTPC